ncbi:MAG: SapC family protein [Rhodoferax sp.]|uniref:SapC family protein n=1 Tax=Rhodoferax sp. TaxID=50421 RepID=UPI003019AC97
MSNFAFYEKVVALNSEVHRNLKFNAPQVNFNFARDSTAVLIAGVEFAEAARDYPIVFVRGQDQQLRPVVLLGVREAQNLFVDESGKWLATYIPAFVRRYPFVLAEGAEPDQLVVCIDEKCKALTSGTGELLIDEAGKLQPLMDDVLQFLQNFQQEFVRTEALTKQLDELGLFVQQGARFDTAGGETFQLNDFYMLDEAKFNQIDDEKLPSLFRSGALGLAYLHLASMGNMRKLLNLISSRSAAVKTVPQPIDKALPKQKATAKN